MQICGRGCHVCVVCVGVVCCNVRNEVWDKVFESLTKLSGVNLATQLNLFHQVHKSNKGFVLPPPFFFWFSYISKDELFFFFFSIYLKIKKKFQSCYSNYCTVTLPTHCFLKSYYNFYNFIHLGNAFLNLDL